MTDTKPSSPMDDPKPDSPASDSATGEEPTPRKDAAEDGHKAPDTAGSDEFASALSFNAWDGEDSTREEALAGTGAGLPPPPEAATPATEEDKGAQAPVPGSKKPPAKQQQKKTHKSGKDAAGKDAKSMSLMGHLGELRTRLVRILIMVMLGFFACYAFSETLFSELVKPLTASMPHDSKLIFTSIPEAFFVYMKVGFVASLFLTSPYTFYQIWAFVAPGLYEDERRNIVPLAAFSAFFFLSGASFCYFVAFPVAFKFFMGFATDTIIPMPSLNEYLSFALKLLVAFGLIFEMPLFAFLLARIGILTAAHLRRWRRYAILTIFILAAVLSPPDVVSQLLMAFPMLILYEMSIWIASMAQKRSKDAGKKEDGEAAENKSEQHEPSREAS